MRAGPTTPGRLQRQTLRLLSLRLLHRKTGVFLNLLLGPACVFYRPPLAHLL